MLHAVIVGIDRYRDPSIADLHCARADAEAMAQLIKRVHPAERRMHVLLDEDATKRNVMVAIGETVPRLATEPEDVVLLYFAGHGSPETGCGPDRASRYLVLHDTEYDSIYATGVDMERELPRWFERIIGPKLILSLIDACFSGRAGGRTFEGPHLRQQRSDFRDTGPISLQALDLGEGRVMIGACDDDQVAREDRELGHGIFTHYVMQEPAGPRQVLTTIGLHSWYESVARAVRTHTEGRQVPVINGRSVLAEIPYLW
ncbi:caspase domain-containing protein [Kitasatospora sp. NPDC090091]|uniref:caspase family protein n=1 Tax=Kitasatospora sp. NPDC090091 TaxID=3364081 RepID=UPI0038199348